RCCPLHAHDPYRTWRWPIEDSTTFGTPTPPGFAGENWAEPFTFSAFCFLHHPSIPQTQNPFPLLFQMTHLFIRFLSQISVDESDCPFDGAQELSHTPLHHIHPGTILAR